MLPVAGTNRTGTKNWSSAELSHMLDLVENNLPLGNADWEALTLTYNSEKLFTTSRPPLRDVASIRFKFKKLRNFNKPTCPSESKLSLKLLFFIKS